MLWHYVAAIVSRATMGDWTILVLGILLLLYILGTWNYDYFQKQHIPSTKPKTPFVGDMLSAFLELRAFPDIVRERYKKAEGHGVYGIFQFTRPTFLVRDPEILKLIAIKEFDSFMNHQTVQSSKTDPIFCKNLFNLEDQAWKDMRATLSPAFTTSKIKGMFSLISECGHQMVQHLNHKYTESKKGALKQPLPIDMKDLFGRLANDVIATAAFGVSCDSLKHPENEFYRWGKIMTKFSKLRTLIFLGFIVFPKLMQGLRLRVLDAKATDFFDSLVHNTIRERQQKGIFRPDMLQLLMQAREGQLKTEKEDAAEAEEIGAKKTKLANEDLAAQAVIFFFAGFETVSQAISFATHLLSHNQDVQKRLHEEIADVMEKTEKQPTYESVQEMKYLDAVISETLRMYPPAILTDRMCREDARLPAGANSGPFTVRKGQAISIPILGIHHDPQYWPDPEKFDPERFNEERKHNIKPFTYIPFGVGPRLCIGQRFAIMEVKLALIHLVANFELHPCSKTKHPLEFIPSFHLAVKGGFWCELKPREA